MTDRPLTTNTIVRYPLIAKLFELISSDNGGCTADEIEAALRGLPADDLDTLAAGEHTDQEAVKAKLREQFDVHVVDSLDALLEVAFQGCYALEKQPDEPDPRLLEAMAELIYLRMYGKDGARWELNESKDVWRDKARNALTKAGCSVPPTGWRCTREAGHDGPCAAVPA